MAMAGVAGAVPADAGAAPRPSPPAGKRADRERFQWSSLALLGPSVVLLAVLFVIPVIYAFYLGFTNLELVGPNAVNWHFTGTQNLQRLGSDPTFFLSLRLTLIFIVGSIVGVVVIGLALAVLLQNSVTWLRILVGGIVVVAWMMPAITAGMTWYASTTASGTFGTLLGMPNSDFLHHEPMLIVTLANVWSQTGFAMLVLGAALRNIPHEVLEAADMEDASRWQRFRLITLPMLRPDDRDHRAADHADLAGQLRADLRDDAGRPGQLHEHPAAVLLPAGVRVQQPGLRRHHRERHGAGLRHLRSDLRASIKGQDMTAGVSASLARRPPLRCCRPQTRPAGGR